MYMLAGGPFGLGPLEIGIILIVMVLIFGVGKVADLGGALGKSVREFRKNVREPDDEKEAIPTTAASSAAPSPSSDEQHCTNCGTQLAAGAKFCAKCGAPVQAAVN